MIKPIRILTLTSGLLLSSLAISNGATAQTESNDITLPTVKRVVTPLLTEDQVGQELQMRFKVHTNGRVYGIKAIDKQPETNDLARSLKRALPHWHFEPATDRHGKPVIVEVVLPIRITSDAESKEVAASIHSADMHTIQQNS